MTNADNTVPTRVILAFGTMEIDAAVQRATLVAAAGRCVLVAGLVFTAYHPPRQHRGWQFRLSHWARPPVVVSMHRLRREAEAQMGRVYRANSERDLRDDGVFAALIQELAAFGDGEVAYSMTRYSSGKDKGGYGTY